MTAPVRFAGTHDGVSIAYRTDGDGPPLVFVRGWITHLDAEDHDPALRAYFTRLRRHLTVTKYDARGNGLSDRVLPHDPTWDDLQADLEAVMDRVDGPVTMWGSSFGGPIAIRYAAQHPERVTRLVLDGTFAFGPTLASEHRQESFLSLLRLAPAQPHAVFASLGYLTDPEPGITQELRVRRGRESIEPALLAPLYSLIYEVDVRVEAAALSMPTLALHRAGSRSVSASAGRTLASLIPDVRLVVLPGTAQNPWAEDPQASLDAIGAFLGVDLRPEAAAATPIVAATSPPVRGEVVRGLGAVIFTDIEASTQATNRLGDMAAQELVRAHNRIVRDALAAHGASEVKHTGDGIMAWAPSISGALEAAADVQQAIEAHNAAHPAVAFEVRIGINAGEPLSEEDDLFGSVVQLARRTCDAGRAGDVLVTTTVRDLVQGKGFLFEAAGLHRLKGFDQPVPLWRLRIPDVGRTDPNEAVS